jgi:hypothetical protein
VSSQPFMFNHSPLRRAMFNRVLSKRIMLKRFLLNRRQIARAAVFGLFASLLSAASVSLALGQTFTMSIPLGLNRPAVDPGGSAIATIDLTSTAGFSSPVSLSCIISSGPVTASPPNCQVSPQTQTPPGSASLNITTTNTTSVGLYNFTVTGSSGSIVQTLSLSLSVQPLSEDYTLSASPVTAVPNPVTAGSIATTTVTISPIGSYSGHQVTLACLSVTPVVPAGPVCAFQPITGSGPVHVTAGSPATATLTITTYGPVPTTGLRTRRTFYALWLLLPSLVFAGALATKSRRKGPMGVLLLLIVAGTLLLQPSCGSSSNTTNSPTGQTTPKNTYTFTLTGVDENGAAPSNSTTAQATVSVTVN